MARESKQDRIVRSILDQTIEHIFELNGISKNPNNKEADVEVWVQGFLKNCLGYTPSMGYVIRAQESKGKMRPDLIVFHNEKPIFVVEVKRLGFDMDKSDFRSGKVQLNEYLSQVGQSVRWGILTNGIEWKLYDFSQYGGLEVASFDLRNDEDVLDSSKRAVEEECYEFLNFHENSFSAEQWDDLSKEAMAFSNDSLTRAILSHDIVKSVAKCIRGEHEYKACQEVLTDKIYALLEYGLSSSKAWNETKRFEVQKYIKLQKRASKRSRRVKKAIAEPVVSTTPVIGIVVVKPEESGEVA